MTKPIVIYGAGPFARLMHYYFTTERASEIAAFTVDREFIDSDHFCDLPVIPFDELPTRHSPEDGDLFVAVGYRNMRNRRMLFEKAKKSGYALANFVSRRAIIEDNVTCGENNVFMPGVHIEPFTSLGHNNLLWSDTVIGHDSQIGNHNFFSGCTALAGEVTVGDLCFFGVGSITIEKVNILDETYLAPGCILTSDSEAHAKYAGNPARGFARHAEEGIVIP